MIRHIFNLVQDAHLEGRTPISKIQDVTEIRFKRKFGWASEERKTQRFVSSGGLPKNENPKIHDRVGFRVPKNGKIPRFDLVGFRRKENQETKIRKIWRASEERKTKKLRFVRSGGLLKNENPKIRSGGLPKNENPKIRLGGLLKNENPKIKIRSGGLLCGKTKIHKIGWSGLPTFGKRRTKIRKSRVSRVSSEERKKPKIRK
ncbi:unnamed protein product [Rhizophagus irregularis]|uniref:Uncharacterized protein n=1 Tax=Rhizophagus irregularis TaxID=588596 RepID=A0A915ZXB9_9GLOM|nr:unnamed protein product [Rhizophagus irregularis]